MSYLRIYFDEIQTAALGHKRSFAAILLQWPLFPKAVIQIIKIESRRTSAFGHKPPLDSNECGEELVSTSIPNNPIGLVFVGVVFPALFQHTVLKHGEGNGLGSAVF